MTQNVIKNADNFTFTPKTSSSNPSSKNELRYQSAFTTILGDRHKSLSNFKCVGFWTENVSQIN
jgi:hypothetical protein